MTVGKEFWSKGFQAQPGVRLRIPVRSLLFYLRAVDHGTCERYLGMCVSGNPSVCKRKGSKDLNESKVEMRR